MSRFGEVRIEVDANQDSGDCTLKDEAGEIVTICDRELGIKWMKLECPDGGYTVVGPDINLKYYRIDGIVYPAGGTIDGGTMPTRAREECVRILPPGRGASGSELSNSGRSLLERRTRPMETREQREQREGEDAIFTESCREIMSGNDAETFERWRVATGRCLHHSDFERHITFFFSRGCSKTYSENAAAIRKLVADPAKWEHFRNMFCLSLGASAMKD